jgi:hypothetical protein
VDVGIAVLVGVEVAVGVCVAVGGTEVEVGVCVAVGVEVDVEVTVPIAVRTLRASLPEHVLEAGMRPRLMGLVGSVEAVLDRLRRPMLCQASRRPKA